MDRLIRSAGHWWIAKQRQRARKSGVAQVAKNMRRQGVPLWVALKILAKR